jgi:hypothetical protein
MTKKERPALTKPLRDERSKLIKDIAAKEQVVECAANLLNGYRWIQSGAKDLRTSWYRRGKEIPLGTEEEKEFRRKQRGLSEQFLGSVEKPLNDAEEFWKKQKDELKALHDRLATVRMELREIYLT